jgi:hypothetical protein
VFIVHTIPVVKTPSKNIDANQWVPKILVHNPPKQIDIKNPTHVDVHIIHPINSPKKFEFAFIQVLGFSKIEP